ncbi:hypothetical protein jhhlp_002979 [Lomentospora prolificans]|uniref:Uncharacterized protein n=1 Tax=Lomentospora prolificans TaxID=41688 RepID=A0A2N3NFL0_9PEZI|nr:hypothetical protein jhhlp_002979 [Lomentospora prolificans]
MHIPPGTKETEHSEPNNDSPSANGAKVEREEKKGAQTRDRQLRTVWDRRKQSKSEKDQSLQPKEDECQEDQEWVSKLLQGRGELEKGSDCRKTPSSILSSLLDDDVRRMSDAEFLETARYLISYPRLRMPVLLSKLLLTADKRFQKYKTRDDILDEAESASYCRSDVERWEWIVQARNSDIMVERFVSSGVRHPIPLLSLVLRPNATFTERASLASLMQYVAKWYGRDDSHLGRRGDPRAFMIPVRRLAFHCCRVWPDLIPVLAKVIEGHIRTTIPSLLPKDKVFAKQNEAYNQALQMFAAAPDHSGRQYMAFIWEAQRTLLRMSGELEQPLMLERKSFEAIRVTLVGLEKTAQERDEALRHGKTWPPFKVIRDGIDEEKDPGDDYTRAVKAGLTMQEAGYSRKLVDDVIDILAGWAPDRTPTIQTRANLSKFVRSSEVKIGPENVWATEIRTTRNAHEAWMVFQRQPESCRRSPQVYGELFAKLTATLPQNENYLPGDGRHVVEVHIPNLSDFEKARAQPPTVEQLYDKMRDDKVRLHGHSLAVLLRTASHFAPFHMYLQDSALDKDIVRWFSERSDKDVSKIFNRVPFGVFQAYISLLCQIHPTALAHTRPSTDDTRITEAIRLVEEYSELVQKRSRQHMNVRPLWNLLLHRLSSPRGLYFSGHPPSERGYATFLLYCDVLSAARKVCAMDCDMFFFTARAVSNGMRAHFAQHIRPPVPDPEEPLEVEAENEVEEDYPAEGGNPDANVEVKIKRRPKVEEFERPVILDIAKELRRGQAYANGDAIIREGSLEGGEIHFSTLIGPMARYLASTFDQLISPVPPLLGPGGEDLSMPKTYGQPRGTEAHVYMQALAHLLDYKGMLRLLQWIAPQWARSGESEWSPAVEKNRYHLRRAICAFRALAEKYVPEEKLAPIRGELELMDGWPGQDEVIGYLQVNWASEELCKAAAELGFEQVAGPEYWGE